MQLGCSLSGPRLQSFLSIRLCSLVPLARRARNIWCACHPSTSRKRAVACECREAGARVCRNVRQAEMNLDVSVIHACRAEVVGNRLPL